MSLTAAMDETVDTTRELSQAWMHAHANAECMSLVELVGLLTALNDAMGNLKLVSDDLQTVIYDRVWKDHQSPNAEVGGQRIEVGRSTSIAERDGERLVAALASRLGDEMGDAGYRVADPDTGELLPPAEVVRQIVGRVADICGLRNKSQNWAKSRLEPLGIDLAQFQQTTKGPKRVTLK